MRAEYAAAGVLAGVGEQVGMGAGDEFAQLSDLLGVVVLGVGAQSGVELGDGGGGWAECGVVPKDVVRLWVGAAL